MARSSRVDQAFSSTESSRREPSSFRMFSTLIVHRSLIRARPRAPSPVARGPRTSSRRALAHPRPVVPRCALRRFFAERDAIAACARPSSVNPPTPQRNSLKPRRTATTPPRPDGDFLDRGDALLLGRGASSRPAASDPVRGLHTSAASLVTRSTGFGAGAAEVSRFGTASAESGGRTARCAGKGRVDDGASRCADGRDFRGA